MLLLEFLSESLLRLFKDFILDLKKFVKCSLYKIILFSLMYPYIVLILSHRAVVKSVKNLRFLFYGVQRNT